MGDCGQELRALVGENGDRFVAFDQLVRTLKLIRVGAIVSPPLLSVFLVLFNLFG